MRYPEKKLDPKWVHSPITPEIVSWCDSFGQFLAPRDKNDKSALTSSQLRRFFGEVKRIKLQKTPSMADIAMLNPMLAYAVGRDMKNGRCATRIQELQQELSAAISVIKTKEDFENFTKIFEAIVAYHKYYGGKDSKN